ncbi:OmpA family protein [Persicobacter diffluens]|uniref:OmpA-like domain-containing protein n=1 Tax=Persicobacter diffluens TaxID=981 RepID=A0AAN4VWQ2_9BACT|nr:hypothetical protein PEDI_16700 [Persicobacter diffluens]
MKFLFTILLLLLSSSLTIAQKSVLVKANEHFERHEYTAAIENYEKYLQNHNSTKVSIRLAEAYMATKRYPEALESYRLLIKLHPTEGKLLLPYAELLMNQKKYKNARAAYKRYLQMHPEDKKSIRHKMEACSNFESLQSNHLAVRAEQAAFNSEYNDFSPLMMDQQLIWCSSRPHHKQKYLWDNQHFINLFGGEWDPSMNVNGITALPKKINAKTHEGPATYDPENQRLYFTRNADKENAKRHLEIFYTDQTERGWTKPKSMGFHRKGHSEGHPTLSPDGNSMVFTADFKGGLGGTDLYISQRTPYGQWQQPKNLGEAVNSPGDEMFPYWGPDDYLYFSSDFYPGLGGLDLFRVKIMENEYGTIEHLGAPFNSEKDDFGIYLIDASEKNFKGYFSSNRADERGNDDIYHFHKIFIDLNVLVLDKTTEKPIRNSTVGLRNQTKNLDEGTTDQWGEYYAQLSPEEIYRITVDHPEYAAYHEAFNTQNLEDHTTLEKVIYLEQGFTPRLQGTVVSKETDQLLSPAQVSLRNLHTEEEIRLNSPDGNFSFVIDPGTDYILSAKTNGYLTYSEEFYVAENIQQDLIKKLPLERLEQDKILDIENIYYDFDRSNITSQASTTLDKVVIILRDNPDIVIELSSHTDARGTDQYNRKLSAERAKAAMEYISGKGIEPFRMVYKYYGETQPKIPCAPGQDCDEEVHAINRRTEFKIIGF